MFLIPIANTVRSTIILMTMRNGALHQVITAATATTHRDEIFFIHFMFEERWEGHYRNYHQWPDGGYTFTPNTSDEDYADIANKADDSEPDMILLPDNRDEFAAGADDHVHSTPMNSPPPSPAVIQIVAVDENRCRQPPNPASS